MTDQMQDFVQWTSKQPGSQGMALAKVMRTLKTPNATVHYTPQFNQILIEPSTQGQPLDLMDIKEIYATFFREWLHWRIDQMKPDDVIKLGYYVGEH